VSNDTGNLEFNTAIAQMMIFINEIYGDAKLHRALWEPFVILLSPYAPHLAEELWEKLGKPPSITQIRWPDWDEELTKEAQVTVVFQINGKIRDRAEVSSGTSEEELSKLALQQQRIQKLLEGKEIVKIITVADKLVNIVAR
jgi:leucyl-tRNA synthetase